MSAIAFVSLTLSFSKGYQSADQEHSTYYANRDAAEVSYSECLKFAASLDGARQCINDTEQTTRDAERAEQDLNAQREMAQWAEGMLWAAWIVGFLTVGATVVGVRYVYLTLVATQDVVRETTRIGEAQSRAYVHAEKAHFFWGGKNQDRPRVEIWVRNTGQTPAHWYEIRVKDFIYEHGTMKDRDSVFEMISLPDKLDGPWGAVPPDAIGNKATYFFFEDHEVAEFNKASEDITGLHDPTHGFSIAGEIRYRTFFGETFISQFVFGRNSLPSYRIKEVRSRNLGGLTINDNIEEPIPLQRYESKLKTYEKVDG